MRSVKVVSLRDPLGIIINPDGTTDREEIGTSTLIARDDLKMETEHTHGRIGDIVVFKRKMLDRDQSGNPVWAPWVEKCGIPTTNIRSYVFDGAEPQAKDSQARSQGSATK